MLGQMVGWPGFSDSLIIFWQRLPKKPPTQTGKNLQLNNTHQVSCPVRDRNRQHTQSQKKHNQNTTRKSHKQDQPGQANGAGWG